MLSPGLRTMQKYIYDSLDEEAGEIRLLIILPGAQDDPIELLLYTTVLTDEFTPQYEALSYAWGSQDDPVHIAVKTASHTDVKQLFGGFKGLRPTQKTSTRRLKRFNIHRSLEQNQGSVSITQQLGQLLPYLRDVKKPRALWIDALCVNQSDLEERGHQVQRMSDVYQGAEKVIVWTGTAYDDSDIVLELLESIASHVDYNFPLGMFSSKDSDPSEAHVSRTISLITKLFAFILT